MGRPRKTIAQKILDGDTRKVGAQRFAEEIASAWQARRGIPELPAALKGRSKDPKERARLKVAREHWEYLMREATADGLVAIVDQGVFMNLALLHAAIAEAGKTADFGKLAQLSAEYRQTADRCGLTEVGRAKLQRPAPPKVDEVEEAMMEPMDPAVIRGEWRQ